MELVAPLTLMLSGVTLYSAKGEPRCAAEAAILFS